MQCHHDDVLHDTNKDLDRVILSEELSKTATWKQLTYAEKKSNSPNASPNAGGDANDGSNKKRRRKRSRTANNKPPSSNTTVNNKELSMTNDAKSHPVEHSELLTGSIPTAHHPDPDNEAESIPPLVMQPWMTVADKEVGGSIGYEDDIDNAISVREKHLNNLNRQGSMDRPPHMTMSRQNSTLESGSNNRLKHLPRQSSDERNPSSSSSFKRQQRTNKERSGGGNSSSSSFKRHDSSKKERKHSSHKGPKVGGHNHGHHNTKQQSQVEEIALPPWEQPYHSPPRKDLGLLHAATDDSHLTLPDVDSASVKVDDAAPSINDTVVTKTTLNDDCSVSLTDDIDKNDNCRRKDSVLSSDTPTTSHYPNFNDSGDASAELD